MGERGGLGRSGRAGGRGEEGGGETRVIHHQVGTAAPKQRLYVAGGQRASERDSDHDRRGMEVGCGWWWWGSEAQPQRRS
jgi:hypothetical protein